MTTIEGLEKIDVSPKEDMKDDAGAHSSYTPGTAQEQRLLRKIDRRLLPMLWIM